MLQNEWPQNPHKDGYSRENGRKLDGKLLENAAHKRISQSFVVVGDVWVEKKWREK